MGADSGVFMRACWSAVGSPEAIEAKSTLVRRGFVAELVAKGEVEMAAQQIARAHGASPASRRRRCHRRSHHAIVFSAARFLPPPMWTMPSTR
jgi:hypothetical protein